MSDIREAFEAQMSDWGYQVDKGSDGGYLQTAVSTYWKVWQLGAKSQTAPAVQEGWNLVPAEMTGAMLRAWLSAPVDNKGGDLSNMQLGYRAMLDAAPQPDHSPDGTVTDYGTKSAPAADGGEVEPVDDSSTVYRIGDLGSQIRNLGCLQKHNEEMANSLAELAHQAWVLQRDVMRELTATHPAQPRNEVQAVTQFKEELVKSVKPIFRPHIEGVCAVVLDRLRSNGGDESE